jgi:hypothetical protein
LKAAQQARDPLQRMDIVMLATLVRKQHSMTWRLPSGSDGAKAGGTAPAALTPQGSLKELLALDERVRALADKLRICLRQIRLKNVRREKNNRPSTPSED